MLSAFSSALQGGGVRGGGWLSWHGVAGEHRDSPTSPSLSAPEGGEELRKRRGGPGGIYPMALDKATVARIATLARIKLPEAERDHLAAELSHILTWIEQLNEVDTAGVEP